MIYTLELTEKVWLDVHYEYDPGEPMIHTYPNGDPGHPGSGPSVEIKEIRCLAEDKDGNYHDVDILPFLELAESELDLWKLDEKILEENHEE